MGRDEANTTAATPKRITSRRVGGLVPSTTSPVVHTAMAATSSGPWAFTVEATNTNAGVNVSRVAPVTVEPSLRADVNADAVRAATIATLTRRAA